ncbi:hypothetical protein SUGI_0979980 [Cryptomeria japonica]|nr:hypothetical protein SUGI_0979980 [Cryptomeria japonica]
MAKKYVLVLLLLLMASSAFASESMVYEYYGYCGFWSGYYKGVCDIFTSGCNDTCKGSDHASGGACVHLACMCFNPC